MGGRGMRRKKMSKSLCSRFYVLCVSLIFATTAASIVSVSYILNSQGHRNKHLHRVYVASRRIEEVDTDLQSLKDKMDRLVNKTIPVEETSTVQRPMFGSGLPRSCRPFPANLDDTMVLHNESLSMEAIENLHPEVKLGGSWEPAECTARHEIAIIIPYRDRDEHLRIFLRHMHPFLQKQQISYTIYVVELTPTSAFNRGFLNNVGFVEALKHKNYPCFIFHDVDLRPENYRNIYRCSVGPQLLMVTRSQENYKVMYKTFMGGVISIPKLQFQIINGYSNNFYNWGGEDDDLFNRMKHHQLGTGRVKPNIGRYYAVSHNQEFVNHNRYEIMKGNKKSRFKEGLSTLRYRLLKTKKMKLYTWILTEPADMMNNECRANR